MPEVEYLNYEVVEDEGWDLEEDDVFEKAEEKDLDEEDFGKFEVYDGEFILEAAEREGYNWPFSCRTGACANCAGIIVEGEVSMDMQQILSDEEIEDRDVRLTCIAEPESDKVKLVYNAKHLDYLQNRVI